jgi:hypothetical protein
MDVQTGEFNFPSGSGSGPRQTKMRHAFNERIGQASVALTGFQAQFTDGDHHFGRLEVGLGHRIVNNSTTGHEVEVFGTFGLRDLSNHWDDNYAGKIQYCLLTIPERTRPIIGPPINP